MIIKSLLKESHLDLKAKLDRDPQSVLSDLKEATLVDKGDILSSNNKAYSHPTHKEEALISYNNLWFIYDLCGDFSSYKTLEEALLEFISPIGDMIYKDMVEAGQNNASNIFA